MNKLQKPHKYLKVHEQVTKTTQVFKSAEQFVNKKLKKLHKN